MREQVIATSDDTPQIVAPLPARRETWRAAVACFTVILDSVALIAGFQVVELVRDYRWLAPGGVPLLVIVIPAYIYCGAVFSSYSVWTLSSLSKSVTSALRALIGALTVVIVCAFLAKFGMKISRSAFLYAALGSCALLIVARALVAVFLRLAMKDGLAHRLFVTTGGAQAQSARVGMDVIDLNSFGLIPDLYDPAQLARISDIICRYDVVYLDGIRMENVQEWVTVLKATGLACEVVVPSSEIHSAVGIGRLGNQDTLVLSRGPLSFGSRLQKRVFDLAVTIPLIILVAPLMIATAIAIRLESPGPAMFTQVRIGLANRPFRIFKFRSMHLADSDQRGDRSTNRDDDRMTRVGRFIRRTSIDELPQLFNVLLGDMSLVGPRPHAEGSRAGIQLFWEVSELYWMRHALKPGITGLAQINGFRGATHDRSDLEARLRYDLEYLQNWSLWNDITILFATLKVVSHANAY